MAHTLSGAVIHMSLLTNLSLPESLVTGGLLFHLSVLPQLEVLTISPAPPGNDLSGRVSRGFTSIRALEVPSEELLRWFATYPLPGLEALKVTGLDGRALVVIARKFSNLRQISIEGASLGSQDLSVLGACFQLEVIRVATRCSLGMDGKELDQFRAMFRNIRTLSIVTQDNENRI